MGSAPSGTSEKASTAKKKTLKATASKTAKKKKEKLDSISRFISNYSENPHLQQIENGYLKHLQAQFAKESHLKEVKKFQILHALRTIQRFWQAKYK
mmetsp:Transcript_7636/g.11853  ORF Transcript_7636/g.11853 Transcript_7636/m.11853 type:complete len:97 (-) Transcript_7636:904-1194(-)